MNITTKHYTILFFTISLACIGVHLWDYLLFPTHFIIGVCVLPILITREYDKKPNYWYVIGSFFFLIMSLLIHIITLYYIGFILIFLFGISYITKGLNHLPLFLLITISPAFNYLKNAIGIPIRLFLSDLSSLLLSSLQSNITLKGNLVTIGNNSFLIDQACAGLNMLTYTLIIGILILTIIKNKRNINWSFWQTSSLLSILFGLSILSNLTRILILIQFKILPENPIHYYTGIICMLLVAIFPFTLLSGRLSMFIKSNDTKKRYDNNESKPYIALVFPTLIFCFIIGFWVENPTKLEVKETIFKNNGQYKTTKLKFGVTKLNNDSILIYEKPLKAFYSAEHSPMICWKGSGFIFEEISTLTINKVDYYYAKLINEKKQTLHTAWWFQSKSLRTIDQLEWRSNNFKTKNNFSLINVTTEKKSTLSNFLKHSIQ